MLTIKNHGFYWYAFDKFNQPRFKSISHKQCVDFVNACASGKELPDVIVL